MRRIERQPRPHWQRRCEMLGFNYHTPGQTYWNESAVYELSAEEVNRIEAAAIELHRLCMLAVEHVIARGLLSPVGVFQEYQQFVIDSWVRRDAALIGRFDLAYDGSGEPKLLEYNADTPTSLLESAVVQWDWLEEISQPEWGQFNRIHELIIARWREILPANALVHLVCQTESAEDVGHVRYMLDTLTQAGFSGSVMDISDIGVEPDNACFIDRSGRPIEHCFKLYPWEWMFVDRFGPDLWSHRTRFIEPAWRTVLNSKALLVMLWELFPGHPNLLPTSWSNESFQGSPHVSKPIQSREGANIEIFGVGYRASTPEPYGGTKVYQAYAPLFSSHDRHAVIGAWMVGDTPAGISVREDKTLITGENSRFVPHVIL